MEEQDKTWCSYFCTGLDQQVAMVQLLPCTASGCHPQSQGTVEEEEEEENEMCTSHMSVFTGLQCVLVLLFLLSPGFPQAQQDALCEVSWSCRAWGIDGSFCQAENLLPMGFVCAMPRGLLYSSAKAIAGLDASAGTSSACAVLTLWWRKGSA